MQLYACSTYSRSRTGHQKWSPAFFSEREFFEKLVRDMNRFCPAADIGAFGYLLGT